MKEFSSISVQNPWSLSISRLEAQIAMTSDFLSSFVAAVRQI